MAGLLDGFIGLVGRAGTRPHVRRVNCLGNNPVGSGGMWFVVGR